jgi:two-component system, NtrC family, sensor histidine kinase HydH
VKGDSSGRSGLDVSGLLELEQATVVLASDSPLGVLEESVSHSDADLDSTSRSRSRPSSGPESTSASDVDASASDQPSLPQVVGAKSTPRTKDKRSRELQEATYRWTGRLFAVLMIGQFVLGLVLAIAVSPAIWSMPGQSMPLHVWLAVGLGGLVSSVSLTLVIARPGAAVTRNVVAIAQMLWSAIIIHLAGGRIEAHFHVFGSLAFLAAYRDWRILIPANLVIIGDHVLRQFLWPESVYGVSDPAWWRFLEHAGWIAFEDIILVIACVVSVREMGEVGRRRAEAESSQQAMVRNQKLAAVGQLAASVGHELRNPLAAVRAAAAFVGKRIHSGQAADPKVPQFLGVIEHELNACSKIISDLLDFARERPPELAPCPLRPLVDDAIALVPNGAAVLLVNEVPADLPVPSLDKDQFRQVITNLVQNAVEAIPSETKGRVVVTGACHGKRIRLSLADNGVGMPKETVDHIFEPLFTTKTKGTGLGLAIVSSVLRRHAAKISVESQLAQGTTFHIDIDVVTPDVKGGRDGHQDSGRR